MRVHSYGIPIKADIDIFGTSFSGESPAPLAGYFVGSGKNRCSCQEDETLTLEKN